jgi:hypothetical protein
MHAMHIYAAIVASKNGPGASAGLGPRFCILHDLPTVKLEKNGRGCEALVLVEPGRGPIRLTGWRESAQALVAPAVRPETMYLRTA